MFNIGCYIEQDQDFQQLRNYFFKLENGSLYCFKLKRFRSEKELYDYYENDNKSKLHIIVMNVKLSASNGIKIASEIRKKYDQEVLIIFYTNHMEYILQSFDVQAFQYWLKPINYSFFQQKMLMTCKHILSMQKSFFPLKIDGDYHVVKTSEIICIKAIKSKDCSTNLTLLTSSGSMSFKGTLSDCLKKLKHPFYLTHRSFIVNIDHALKMHSGYISMNNGEKIPIARSKINTIKQALYHTYLETR